MFLTFKCGTRWRYGFLFKGRAGSIVCLIKGQVRSRVCLIKGHAGSI